MGRPRATEIERFIQVLEGDLAGKCKWSVQNGRYQAEDPTVRAQLEILNHVKEFTRDGAYCFQIRL